MHKKRKIPNMAPNFVILVKIKYSQNSYSQISYSQNTLPLLIIANFDFFYCKCYLIL